MADLQLLDRKNLYSWHLESYIFHFTTRDSPRLEGQLDLLREPSGASDGFSLLQSSREQKTLSRHISSSTEHGHHIRALFCASTATHWDVLDITWSAFELLFGLNHSSASDHRRCNVVECDATLAHLVGQVLRQTLDAGCGSRSATGHALRYTETHLSMHCSGIH